MATAVSICSNALLMLGQKPISSFTEGDFADLASNLYPQVRDAMQRSHTWNCCVRRVILSPDTERPAFGYAYQYLLPTGWLRTLAVGEDGDEIAYKTEGRRILIDEPVLKLRYLMRNEVEDTWDGLLIHGMGLAMKAVMAYAVTKSQAVADSADAKLREFMKTARAVDGQDDPPDELGDYPLFNSRF